MWVEHGAEAAAWARALGYNLGLTITTAHWRDRTSNRHTTYNNREGGWGKDAMEER